MSNNFDPVAGCYDFLSRLLFGQSEIKAQVELLKYIRSGDRILIVGGGTGWILEELAAIHPSGLRITYVESSFKMMARSRKRDYRQNEVRFIPTAIEQFVTNERFDCILTNFFFDLFSLDKADLVFRLMHPLLKSGGYWLFSDFHFHKGEGKLWQALLLKSMYFAARLICGVEARGLPDIEPIFADEGYLQIYTTFHYWNFIKSIAYLKSIE